MNTTCNQTAIVKSAIFPFNRDVRVVASAADVADVAAEMMERGLLVRSYASAETSADPDDFRWIVEGYNIIRATDLLHTLTGGVRDAWEISESARTWDRSTAVRMRDALRSSAELICA